MICWCPLGISMDARRDAQCNAALFKDSQKFPAPPTSAHANILYAVLVSNVAKLEW